MHDGFLERQHLAANVEDRPIDLNGPRRVHHGMGKRLQIWVIPNISKLLRGANDRSRTRAMFASIMAVGDRGKQQYSVSDVLTLPQVAPQVHPDHRMGIHHLDLLPP